MPAGATPSGPWPSLRCIGRMLARRTARRSVADISLPANWLERRRTVYHPKPASREEPIQKFRRVAKTVGIVASVCTFMKRYVTETQEFSLMEMYLNMRADFNEFLDFNKNIYNSKTIMQKGGSRLKKVLGIAPHERTTDHLQVILALVRGNESFQDYPYHTQIQLCKCMFYQTYESRRVVIREGHPAAASYILLSGTVLINKREVDDRTGRAFTRTVHELSDGEAFGESALINDTKRATTVVCKTDVELLIIMKEDFDRIIKEPLMQQREKHIDYCRTLEVFRHFPCEKFRTAPAQFFYQYFKKDRVVIPDSRESDYMVVIKSGSCKVICEVREPVRRRRPKSAIEMDLERAFPVYSERLRRQRQIQQDESTKSRVSDDFTDRLRADVITGMADPSALFRHHEQQDSINHDADTVFGDERWATPSDWTRRGAPETDEESSSRRSSASGGRQRPKSASVVEQRSSLTEDVYNIRFAQIAELKAGAVFGLESLFQRYPARLCLLSQGAECILVSKKLFVNEINPQVLKTVSEIVVSYPTASFVRQRVLENRQWNKYKRTLVKDIMSKSGKIWPS